MNRLTQLLGIRYPILQGGMGNISHAELTAAVSNAGGLGTLGVGTMKPDEVEQKLTQIRELTHQPFAVNIPIGVQPYLKDILQLIINQQVPIVSLSAGNPNPIASRLKERGVKVIGTVASVKHAVKAAAAGVDVVVAEGFEAAGLNASSEITTMALIPQVADAIDLPLVAAGGIGDARGFVAALALGASGVQLGTRLIVSQEAQVHANYKQAIVSAVDTDTTIVGRSFGKTRRLLHTSYAQKLIALERELTAEEFEQYTDEERHVRGALEGHLDYGHLNCGQIGGLISAIPSVQEIIESMVGGAALVMEEIKVRTGI